MLFITYLQKEEKHQIFEKVSADYKLKNLFQFYPFLFIKITFPELVQDCPGNLDPNRCLQILRTFYNK